MLPLFTEIQDRIGRPLSTAEVKEILSWTNELGATDETVAEAYAYCGSVQNKDNVKYVGAVVRKWTEKGLTSRELIEGYLAETDRRHAQYRRVFQALGFGARKPTEAEARIMDTWFGEQGLSMETVLEACGKTAAASRPSIRYVDAVLRNGEKETAAKKKTAMRKAAADYYAFLRERAEEDAGRRLEETYGKIPRIKEIDDTLRDSAMRV